MNSDSPSVSIVMGSERDLDVMAEVGRTLDGFRVPWEMQVISAHRTPDRCRRFARAARGRGIKLIIAGAGKAAHLAGVIASHTALPVIGVPLDGGMGGIDALLSTVQMPRGIPVAAVAVGPGGAVNAALLAVAILALGDSRLARQLAVFRRRQSIDVAAASRRVSRRADQQ